MTPDKILAFITKKRVKLQPVMDSSGKLLRWAAGYVTVAGDKWSNIVRNGQSAHGATPEEAVENLTKIERRKE